MSKNIKKQSRNSQEIAKKQPKNSHKIATKQPQNSREIAKKQPKNSQLGWNYSHGLQKWKLSTTQTTDTTVGGGDNCPCWN